MAKLIKIVRPSVQKELAHDRLALRSWLQNDPLMNRFFEPFLFEDVIVQDHQANDVYLHAAAGLISDQYPIYFFPNSTAAANCFVDSVLESLCTGVYTPVLRAESPRTSLSAASLERSLILQHI